jgi:pimeloyl-ACP methyl ester carboxylesterase/DNA-binding CsgD family transcriptional regulator
VARYDERGFGLSDWNVDDFSLDTRLADLQAVLDDAGLDHFSILGMSQGSAVAMSYAARYPERVTRLILYGTVCGEAVTFAGEKKLEEETFRNMIQLGWAREDPEFRRVFTRRFIPDANETQMAWFDDLQRMSTSAENAIAYRIARQRTDIVEEVARISAPTLILQAVGDRATTFDNAVTVAGQVAGSRLVALDSRNHILLADDPAWPIFVDEVRQFLEPERRAFAAEGRDASADLAQLSERELDVLRLAAEGRANEEIAAELGLSVRTVERHFSNLYLKLGVTGKAARAAAVAELLRGEARAPARP